MDFRDLNARQTMTMRDRLIPYVRKLHVWQRHMRKVDFQPGDALLLAVDRAYENAAFLQKTIKAALAGKIDFAAEIAERQKNLPKKSKLFSVAPRVILDNDASVSATVIEINAKDRPGLLYDITSALTEAGLQISAAKIATFGSRAVDVFYVKDNFGLKIAGGARLRGIEKAAMAALTGCGGDEPLTKAQLIRKGDAACERLSKEASSAIQAAGRQARGRDLADVPDVATDLLSAFSNARRKAADGLDDLTPPSALAARYDDYVAGLREITEMLPSVDQLTSNELG